MKFLGLLILAHAVTLLEMAGAVSVVAGVGLWFGVPVALVVAGVFLLAKAIELDISLGGSS